MGKDIEVTPAQYKLMKRRDELYLMVKAFRPDLYENVVAIASTAGLELEKAALLEHRMMGLVADALGLR